jgi:hypothetical protein
VDIISFTRIFFDIASFVFLVILIFGLKNKRIFALGRMYSFFEERCKFWQVVLGYILFIFTLVFLRVNFLTE